MLVLGDECFVQIACCCKLGDTLSWLVADSVTLPRAICHMQLFVPRSGAVALQRQQHVQVVLTASDPQCDGLAGLAKKPMRCRQWVGSRQQGGCSEGLTALPSLAAHSELASRSFSINSKEHRSLVQSSPAVLSTEMVVTRLQLTELLPSNPVTLTLVHNVWPGCSAHRCVKVPGWRFGCSHMFRISLVDNQGQSPRASRSTLTAAEGVGVS
jgi:hypothetical protein